MTPSAALAFLFGFIFIYCGIWRLMWAFQERHGGRKSLGAYYAVMTTAGALGLIVELIWFAPDGGVALALVRVALVAICPGGYGLSLHQFIQGHRERKATGLKGA